MSTLGDIPAASPPPPNEDSSAALSLSPFMQEFLLAGALSAVSKTVVAPFERARLVMQTQGERIRLGRLYPLPLPGGAHTTISTDVQGGGGRTVAPGSSGRVSKIGSFIEMETVGRHPITTARDSFKYCVKNDGIAVGLFRGNSCTIARVFFTSATAFAVNGSLKTHLSFPEKRYGYIRNFMGNVLMGGIAGTTALVVAQPLDYARTRLAADVRLPLDMKHANPRQFNGVRDVYSKTLKSDGLFGLYRGFGVSSLAVFVKTGLYFGIFDTVRPYLPQYELAPVTRRIDPISGDFIEIKPKVDQQSALSFLSHDQQVFIASGTLGWFATVSASSIGYPFETARRRMMMTCGMEPRMKYRGSMHCLSKVIKLEGTRGLMRGGMINAFTAVSGGLTLAVVDYGKRTMA